ncbi:MAG TPA: DUF4389 domain-containing protein [Conexibacter sp.]|nr:DUF4389 domain-containing protein [Conexibacter sp.]
MAYPVLFQADYREEQSRLTTFFRIIVAIPWMLMSIVWGLAALVGVVVGWFSIVFTGRYPEFAYDLVTKALRFGTRFNAWYWLMTDVWPPFDGDDHPEYPVRLLVPERQEQYSRVKTLFRIILVIPVLIMIYLFNILIQIVGLLLWVVIVITGKAPKGLWDVQKMGVAYVQRGNAYHLLVTESYPPLSADDGDAAVPPAPAAPAAGPSPFGG